MAVAQKSFERVQIGREANHGVKVPATRQLIGNGTLLEAYEYYHSAYPMGKRATPGGAGIITQRGTNFTQETELTSQDILWPLLTGIKGGVVPTAGTAPDTSQTWEFIPDLDTGDPEVDSATVEFSESDGVTNHVVNVATYVMTSEFSLGWQAGQIATLNWSGFGRARQDGPLTPALVPYTTRKPLLSTFTGFYADDTWADIGTNQLLAVVDAGELTVNTGLAPVYKMDQRPDLDFSLHRPGIVSGTLSLTLELAENATAEYEHWRNNDLRYFRIQTRGAEIAPSVYHQVTADLAVRLNAAPTFSENEGEIRMELNGELVYDFDSGNILRFEVINDVAAEDL